ncbi:DUF2680 domain-containing protein [Desulforamulus aeronauticus]|uniref:DUF2680 domain-containing protein n=1 Tax=Desulforamulus aeronauticus DSM 10349 TaxID=1121421 RepID=A0A1M6TXD9_9FIRM|nr:DUF2680 domain-containing protein [Desulforamulus aeronauticus]SHK61692.1 Protein of unknown function [Desulforamulus aeronauticus DSM 10349]
MNKQMIRLALVLMAAVALVVPTAFATDDASSKTWFEQRLTQKKASVDEAVKNGRITAEQGETWKQHFEQMQQFHAQNGYLCPGNGNGNCGMGKGIGNGNGMGGRWGSGSGIQNPQVQSQ